MSGEADDRRAAPADDLVVRAKSDRAAFGCLFDRYYPHVLRYCLRRLSERATAEDVTSDVFLQVATHLRGFAGTSETDFRRWLFRIATNSIQAQQRRAGRRREILRTAAREHRLGSGVAGERDGPEKLDWQLIHEALLELDEREQTIISLRFFAGLSHEEIADVVDSTAGAVRTAMSRTLARLRKRFDPSRPARRDS